MAAHLAEAVHRGIDYDAEVDTSVTATAELAASLRRRLGLAGSGVGGEARGRPVGTRRVRPA